MSGHEPEALDLRRLHRVAQRWSSPHLSEHVLEPLLADLQFEYARARTPLRRAVVRLRGMSAFWRAFLSCGALASVRRFEAFVEGGSRDLRPVAALLLRAFGLAALVTGLLTLGAPGMLRLPASTWVFAVPASLLVSLPLGVLFGLIGGEAAWAPRGRAAHAAVSLVAASASFVLAGWVVPAANQEYRTRAWRAVAPGSPAPVRGDRELTLQELGVRAAALRAEGRTVDAARHEVEWHKKPGFAALCVAMALSASAIQRRWRDHWARYVVGLVVAGFAYALSRWGEQAADAGHLAPPIGVWGPVLVLGLGAAWAGGRPRGTTAFPSATASGQS